jgi:hypothetical protein
MLDVMRRRLTPEKTVVTQRAFSQAAIPHARAQLKAAFTFKVRLQKYAKRQDQHRFRQSV